MIGQLPVIRCQLGSGLFPHVLCPLFVLGRGFPVAGG